MKKTLIVHYLPNGSRSSTKKILDGFLTKIPSDISNSIEILDLIKNPAPSFDLESMEAYTTKAFMGQPITPAQQASLNPFEKLAQQFKDADYTVFAFPMHNFSIPGPFKTYIDAVMYKGICFDINKFGTVGLMPNKKTAIFYTSGGYYTGAATIMDNIRTLINLELNFLGINTRELISAGTNDQTKMEQNMHEAIKKAEDLAAAWYGKVKVGAIV